MFEGLEDVLSVATALGDVLALFDDIQENGPRAQPGEPSAPPTLKTGRDDLLGIDIDFGFGGAENIVSLLPSLYFLANSIASELKQVNVLRKPHCKISTEHGAYILLSGPSPSSCSRRYFPDSGDVGGLCFALNFMMDLCSLLWCCVKFSSRRLRRIRAHLTDFRCTFRCYRLKLPTMIHWPFLRQQIPLNRPMNLKQKRCRHLLCHVRFENVLFCLLHRRAHITFSALPLFSLAPSSANMTRLSSRSTAASIEDLFSTNSGRGEDLFNTNSGGGDAFTAASSISCIVFYGKYGY